MSSPDFVSRRRSILERLREEELQGYYTNSLLNLRYLTGFDGTAGGLLLSRTDTDGSATLFVDGRYRNYASQLCDTGNLSVQLIEDNRHRSLDHELSRQSLQSIHFERDELQYGTFLSIKNKVTSPDRREYGDNWVAQERQRKDTFELDTIEEAIELTLDVFELIESWLEPGLSELDLSRSIRRELESRSEGLAFDPLVLIGENTANPHCPATDRSLSDEDALLVDMGLKINGYCSDITRMFFMDSVDEKYRELYDLSKQAAARAFKEIESGRSVKEITMEAHQVIENAGYGDNLRHGLGHGVGLNVHEQPSLSDSSNAELETGMVVTLEPGIYIDGFGGGRIEHMIVVEEDSARLLDTPDDILRQELTDNGNNQ
ncbi:MAG: M24 family metallopeptidase [bacterium]